MKCRKCGGDFKGKKGLAVHSRVHTGVGGGVLSKRVKATAKKVSNVLKHPSTAIVREKDYLPILKQVAAKLKPLGINVTIKTKGDITLLRLV